MVEQEGKARKELGIAAPTRGHHDQAVAELQSLVIFSTFRDPSPSTAVITSR